MQEGCVGVTQMWAAAGYGSSVQQVATGATHARKKKSIGGSPSLSGSSSMRTMKPSITNSAAVCQTPRTNMTTAFFAENVVSSSFATA